MAIEAAATKGHQKGWANQFSVGLRHNSHPVDLRVSEGGGTFLKLGAPMALKTQAIDQDGPRLQHQRLGPTGQQSRQGIRAERGLLMSITICDCARCPTEGLMPADL